MTALNQDRVLVSHQCADKECMCYVCSMFETLLDKNNKFEACFIDFQELSKLKHGCPQAMESLCVSLQALWGLPSIYLPSNRVLQHFALALD